jgi:hypothetical protein
LTRILFCSLFGGDLILSGLIDFCFQLLDEYSQSTVLNNESSFSVIELLKTLASKWLSDIVRVGLEYFYYKK